MKSLQKQFCGGPSLAQWSWRDFGSGKLGSWFLQNRAQVGWALGIREEDRWGWWLLHHPQSNLPYGFLHCCAPKWSYGWGIGSLMESRASRQKITTKCFWRKTFELSQKNGCCLPSPIPKSSPIFHNWMYHIQQPSKESPLITIPGFCTWMRPYHCFLWWVWPAWRCFLPLHQ